MKVEIEYEGEWLTVIGDHTPEEINHDHWPNSGDSARFEIEDILSEKISVYDDFDSPGHLEDIELGCIKELTDYGQLF